VFYNSSAQKKLISELKYANKSLASEEKKILEMYLYLNKISFKYLNTKLPVMGSVHLNGIEEISPEEFTNIKTGTIIFHFSEKNCDECVLKELKKIKKFIVDNKRLSQHIMILSNYSNSRYLLSFKIANKLDLKIYNTSQQFLSEINLPFYFYLDESLTFKDIYFPIKDMPDLTETYLTEMYRKHYKN